MQAEPRTILEYRAAPCGWRPRASFFLVMSYFTLFGILIGAQGVLWPSVLAALRVSEGVFGTAQLVSPSVAIVFLLLGGFWSDTLELRKLIVASLIFLALSCYFFAGAGEMTFF